MKEAILKQRFCLLFSIFVLNDLREEFQQEKDHPFPLTEGLEILVKFKRNEPAERNLPGL